MNSANIQRIYHSTKNSLHKLIPAILCAALLTATLLTALSAPMVFAAADTFGSDVPLQETSYAPLHKTNDVFDDGLLAYRVISAENLTAAVTGLHDAKGLSTAGGRLVVPDAVDFEGVEYDVTGIDDWCFADCTSLTGIDLPETLEFIGDYAFYRSSLKTIRLPEKLILLGEGAFMYNLDLRSASISASLERIPNSAFSYSAALEEVIFAADSVLLSIGGSAFNKCESLREIVLPETVCQIETTAFARNPSLEYMVIPDGVSALQTFTFIDCKNLKEVVLPSALATYEANAFNGCDSLESLQIAAGNAIFSTEDGVLYGRVQLFGGRANNIPLYDGVKLALLKYPAAKPGSSFTVPDGVEVISPGAFTDSGELTSITIPETISYIGSGFNTKLESLTFLKSLTLPFPAEPPLVFESNAFNGMNLVLYVPDPESAVAYQQALDGFKPGGMVTIEPISSKNPGENGGNNPDTKEPDDDKSGNNNTGNSEPGDNETDKPGNSGSDKSGSNTNSSGSSSNSSGSNNAVGGTNYGSTQTTSDFRSLQGPLVGALRAADAGKSSTAVLTITDYRSLSLDTLKQLAAEAKNAGKNLAVQADTIKNGALQLRLQFDPAQAAQPVLLTGSVNSKHTQEIKAVFERSFQTRVVVLELAQQTDFGMDVQITVKANLNGLNTKTLCLYSYNQSTNQYTPITPLSYDVDQNGYLSFRTSLAGDIIITDKPLQKSIRSSLIWRIYGYSEK